MGQAWDKFKENTTVHRLVTLCLIILVLYAARSMMNTILLTFIFTYLIVHLIRFTQKKIPSLPAQVIVVLAYSRNMLYLCHRITFVIPPICHFLRVIGGFFLSSIKVQNFYHIED